MARKIPFTPVSLDAIINVRILADPLTPGSGDRSVKIAARSAGNTGGKLSARMSTATLFGGLYPTYSIAAAREWARGARRAGRGRTRSARRFAAQKWRAHK